MPANATSCWSAMAMLSTPSTSSLGWPASWARFRRCRSRRRRRTPAFRCSRPAIRPPNTAIGPLRALAKEYPAAQQGLGIGSSNVASLSPQGQFAQQAYESLGYKVSLVQEKPPSVTNFRVYMQQMKLAGAKAYLETVSVDPAPEVVAMSDVGWKPSFVLWSFQFYDPKSVAAAKSGEVSPFLCRTRRAPGGAGRSIPGAAADPQHHDCRRRAPEIHLFQRAGDQRLDPVGKVGD